MDSVIAADSADSTARPLPVWSAANRARVKIRSLDLRSLKRFIISGYRRSEGLVFSAVTIVEGILHYPIYLYPVHPVGIFLRNYT